MKKQDKKTAAVVIAAALLLWWLRPKEVVTAGIRFEGVVNE
jgi:hypothetical protein